MKANGSTSRRMGRIAEAIDAREQTATVAAEARSRRIAEMETAGLTEAELDTLIEERIALLQELGEWTEDFQRELGLL